MKNNLVGKSVHRVRRFSPGLALTIVAMLAQNHAGAIPVAPALGLAGTFGVLGASAVTVAGPTTINGDLGSYPTPAITINGAVTVNGVNQRADAAAAAAHADLLTGFAQAAAAPVTTYLGPAADLSGDTLAGGVYNGSSSLAVTGTLTLDADGNPNEVWIFQAGSTLLMTAASQIVLTGGAQASNVYWEVGSSATIGADTTFEGDILAYASITLGAGATVDGLVAAETGAITMANNIITSPDDLVVPSVPDGGNTMLMLGSGFLALAFVSRKVMSPAK
jgi:hypothetical protein